MRELRYSDFAHRIDIDAFEEAIGFVGEDDGKGNDVGHCPDPWGLHKHGDTTGKFAIHREKKVFNCWVCDGGNLLSLAMATQDLGEEDAIHWLYQFASEQSDESFEAEIDELLREDEKKRDPILPFFNERVLDRFVPDDDDYPYWHFLLERGIDTNVALRHHVGYDPDAVKLTKRDGGMRYEGPGITFPHFWRGKLVGWQTRWLDDDRPKWVGKYKNTTDMPKRHTIWDYERWYLEQNPLVVVESVPTALRVQSEGFPSICTFGAGITPEQLKLLRGCQQGLILAPDNDNPGMKFVATCTEYLEPYVEVRVCEPVGEEGSGADLGDTDRQTIIQRIEHSKDLSLY